MINKLELQSIINKYYLNGTVEAVKWDIKDNKLSIKFTSPTKEMIGEVIANMNLENASIGINNTSQLIKLLNITTGEVMLSFVKSNKIYNKLIIADSQFTVNYTLANTITIPKAGTYTGSEIYDLEASFDKESLQSLIKAKSSLDDSSTVVIKPFQSIDGDNQLEFIFGGDIEYSNKVSFYLPLEVSSKNDFELGFNSDLFKEILNANKDFTKAKLFVNLEGIMKLKFETETTNNTYYIVKKEI